MGRTFRRLNPIVGFLILVPLLQLSLAAAPVCIVPPTGLVSWWTGDTDASDLYAVNNPSGANAISHGPGEVANGFTFGSGGYVDIAASSSLANKKFTWTAWAKPEGPGPNNDFVGNIIVDQQSTSTYAAVALTWRATDNRFLFFFGTDTSEFIVSSDTFAPGTFYFVAGTFDGMTFRLYVNGVLQGSFFEPKAVSYSTRTWEIGSQDAGFRAAGFPRTWNGTIDEVQAYKVALAAPKLLSIYKAGVAGMCKAPVIVTPATMTFASQAVGTTSAAKAVTVTNNRNVMLTLDGVTFTGTNPTDFALWSTTCGSTLAARKNCKVSVTFTPAATKTRSAVLNVNDSDAGSPQTSTLKGTGK
jgi:hypothetical protein